MTKGTQISDHLSVLNAIVTELKVIGVKIEDDDKALRLLWSLPTSFKHLFPTWMHGKENVDLEIVIKTLLSKERRLGVGNKEASNDSALTIGI